MSSKHEEPNTIGKALTGVCCGIMLLITIIGFFCLMIAAFGVHTVAVALVLTLVGLIVLLLSALAFG